MNEDQFTKSFKYIEEFRGGMSISASKRQHKIELNAWGPC